MVRFHMEGDQFRFAIVGEVICEESFSPVPTLLGYAHVAPKQNESEEGGICAVHTEIMLSGATDWGTNPEPILYWFKRLLYFPAVQEMQQLQRKSIVSFSRLVDWYACLVINHLELQKGREDARIPLLLPQGRFRINDLFQYGALFNDKGEAKLSLWDKPDFY